MAVRRCILAVLLSRLFRCSDQAVSRRRNQRSDWEHRRDGHLCIRTGSTGATAISNAQGFSATELEHFSWEQIRAATAVCARVKADVVREYEAQLEGNQDLSGAEKQEIADKIWRLGDDSTHNRPGEDGTRSTMMLM